MCVKFLAQVSLPDATKRIIGSIETFNKFYTSIIFYQCNNTEELKNPALYFFQVYSNEEGVVWVMNRCLGRQRVLWVMNRSLGRLAATFKNRPAASKN